MATKKEKRLAAAAAARAALGIGDEDGPAGVPPSSEPAPVPPRHGGSSGSKPKSRRAKGVVLESGDAEGEPGGERSVLPEPSHETATADAKAHGLVQVTDAAGSVDPKHWPKKHPAGSLARGTSVWYRGERFWVEYAPPTWDKGCYARITQHRVHPDANIRSGSDLGEKANFASFCVHADLLALAPTVGNYYSNQPTVAGVAARERAKRGEKDVGDPVAVMLREAKSLDDVYRIGGQYLEVQVSDLKAKYQHLNPGQQRMNIGNRMRGKWKKEQR